MNTIDFGLFTNEYVVVVAVIIVGLIFFGIILFNADIHIESEQKRAGRHGERIATHVISEVLNGNDVLFTNVCLSYEGKETELDNVIVNNRGVFIVEVKNYNGVLSGDEDDFYWDKSKYTDSGNFYQKQVKNPIKQVKRQVYILKSILQQNGIDVWVEGYAFLLERNSPVESPMILESRKDIHEAIHVKTNARLSNEQKERIVEIIASFI